MNTLFLAKRIFHDSHGWWVRMKRSDANVIPSRYVTWEGKTPLIGPFHSKVEAKERMRAWIEHVNG